MTNFRPRKTALQIASDFAKAGPLKLLYIGCGLYAMFTLADIALTAMNEGLSIDSAINGVLAAALILLTVRLCQLSGDMSKESAARAARASIIVFAVILLTVFMLALLYYTTWSIINGLDADAMAEYGLAAEDVTRFNDTAFPAIANMAFSFIQGLAFLFFFRALKDIKTMAGAMRPDRNACRTASIFAAVTAGFSIAAVLFDLSSETGFVSTMMNILYDIPCIMIFASMAFLCKQTADDVSALKGAAK